MAVSVADIVTFLGGTPSSATAYLFYGHSVTVASIQQKRNLSTRYWTESLTDSIIQFKAQLVDDLILHDTCFRIVYQDIMGQLMVSGFSYSTLQLSVNLGTFPQIVTDLASQLLAAVRNYIHLLADGADTDGPFDNNEVIDTDFIP